MATTAETIRAIVADQLFLSVDISDHDSLSGLGMDSLDMAEIVLAVEHDLGIDLDLMMKFDTVFQLIEAVEAVV